MTFSQLFTTTAGLRAAGLAARTPSMRGYVERTEPMASQSGPASRTLDGTEYETVYDVVFHENPGYAGADDSASAYGFRCFQSGSTRKWRALSYSTAVVDGESVAVAAVAEADDALPAVPLALDASLLDAVAFGDWSVVDAATMLAAMNSTKRW